MKNPVILAVAVLVTCGSLSTAFAEKIQTARKLEEPKTSAAKVKKETVEAVDAAGTFVGEKKEEFAARMRGNLDEIDREIEGLKLESQEKSSEVRDATKRKIRDLQSKRDELNRRYDALEKSTGKAWTKMKSGIEKAWGDVRSAYSEAKSELATKK